MKVISLDDKREEKELRDIIGEVEAEEFTPKWGDAAFKYDLDAVRFAPVLDPMSQKIKGAYETHGVNSGVVGFNCHVFHLEFKGGDAFSYEMEHVSGEKGAYVVFGWDKEEGHPVRPNGIFMGGTHVRQDFQLQDGHYLYTETVPGLHRLLPLVVVEVTDTMVTNISSYYEWLFNFQGKAND